MNDVLPDKPEIVNEDEQQAYLSIAERVLNVEINCINCLYEYGDYKFSYIVSYGDSICVYIHIYL